MIGNPVQNTGRRRWLVYTSYAIACGMVICFAVILIQFLLWLFPFMDPRGMVLVCSLAVLEAFFSFWLVKRLPTAQKQIAYYRGTELAILLIVMKLFTELRAGPASFWNNLLLWPVQFPLNIITGQYLLSLLPTLASWWAGCLFAMDLSLLGVEDASIHDERIKTAPVHTLILRRFFSLGFFSVILAGIPAQKIIQTALPVAEKGVPGVVAYFVLGIALLSLTRYITLETDWRQSRLHIPGQIPRRWFTHSTLILAVMVCLVIWLPTRLGVESLGLLDTLNAVFLLLYKLVLIIEGLFILVFSLLASLLTRSTPEAQAPVSQAPPPPTELPTSQSGTFVWDLLKSILLWGGLVFLIIVVLRQYIAYHRNLTEELQRFRPLRWLLTVWDQFIASFRKANKSVGAYIQDRLKRLRKMVPESSKPREWDFVNPRRLPPRQKVIFYYLALVRRAREAGFPRQDGQTPYEYARILTSRLKEEKDGVDAMTKSFIEARYSCHDIPARTARQTESIWEAIRRVLRSRRRSRP